MSNQLGGYTDDNATKGSGRKEVTVTTSDGKTYLDVVDSSSALKRKTGTVTVVGGEGSVSLSSVDIRSNFIGVQAPGSTDTFNVVITDSSGVIISDFEARSSSGGCARSKSLGIPIYDVTINISDASADGDYTYLIMG